MKKTVTLQNRLRQSQMNLFYIPALILFSFFVIYPFVRGIYISTTNWNGYSQKFKSVGISNYIRMLTDKNVRTALINTLVYGFGSTLLQNVLGLALALFLNSEFRGRSALRAVIYMPVMIAPLIMGYIMYFFFAYNRGALNDIMMILGKERLDWMADGTRAVVLMTVVNALQFVGISMVIYLAGLQNIPAMYYEAAAIDGISTFDQFRYITLPLLHPAVTSAVTVNLIGGLKLYDIISALTSGGPGYASHSLSTLIHRTYFGAENAGYAAAIGLLSFLLIMVISTIVTRLLAAKEVDLQ